MTKINIIIIMYLNEWELHFWQQNYHLRVQSDDYIIITKFTSISFIANFGASLGGTVAEDDPSSLIFFATNPNLA